MLNWFSRIKVGGQPSVLKTFSANDIKRPTNDIFRETKHPTMQKKPKCSNLFITFGKLKVYKQRSFTPKTTQITGLI